MPGPHTKKLDPAAVAKCVRLYRAGLNPSQIGNIVGVSGQGVRWRLKQSGELKKRPIPERCACGTVPNKRYCSRQCQGKSYYDKNKEYVKAKSRQYIADNKEAVAKKKSEYRKKKRRELAAAQLARYYANKDAILAKNREYMKGVPKEKIDAYHEKSRCKKRKEKMEMQASVLSLQLL